MFLYRRLQYAQKQKIRKKNTLATNDRRGPTCVNRIYTKTVRERARAHTNSIGGKKKTHMHALHRAPSISLPFTSRAQRRDVRYYFYYLFHVYHIILLYLHTRVGLIGVGTYAYIYKRVRTYGVTTSMYV